jgi:hypothetical protein
MEFGNDFLRQQQMGKWSGHVFKNACSKGMTEDQANSIAEAVIYYANTILAEEEPSELLMNGVTDYICQSQNNRLLGRPP